MRNAFARTAQLSRTWRRSWDAKSRHQAVPHATSLIASHRTAEDWARHGGGLIDHGQAGLALPVHRAQPAERP